MNLHGLDIAEIHTIASSIAYRLCQDGIVLCSVEELRSEATYHTLCALQSYDPEYEGNCTPGGFAYNIAYYKTVDYIRDVVKYRNGRGRPKYTDHVDFSADLGDLGSDDTTSIVALKKTAQEDENIEACMTAYDHERALRRLPLRERAILDARVKGLYLWQIGYHFGVSEQRVHQIQKAARERYRRLAAA